VAVEVAEAEHNARTLKPGVIQAFISPKVSAKDAPYELAKKEHLADDDMIRIHWINTDGQGEVTGKSMQSLLVRDVPLSAWVDMLQDPANIFGRQIVIDDPESSLAVMQVFRELELPADHLPEGVVSLIEAVLPYVPTDGKAQLEKQLALFRGDQQAIHELAEGIAKRWLHFEVAMADSLYAGRAHPVIADFVEEMWNSWTDDDHSLLNLHTLPDGSLGMSRPLAARLQQAKQNLLLVPAAVVVQNERVLEQIDPHIASQIQMEEMRIQQMIHDGRSMEEVAVAERAMNQMVAKENVKVGAGCAGDNFGNFRQEKKKKQPGQEDDKTQSAEEKKAEEANNKAKWKWSRGLCLIGNCPTRPGKTMVGPCSVCWKCQKKFDRGEKLEGIIKDYEQRQEKKARYKLLGKTAAAEQAPETPFPAPAMGDGHDPHDAESPAPAPVDPPAAPDHDEKP
jgi:hypothetical protein